MLEKLLTLPDVEAVTQRKVSTLREDIREGRLEATRVGSEGRISLPIRRLVSGRGQMRTEIGRVMLVTATAYPDNSETDSPIHVRITAGNSVAVDHTIPRLQT